MSALPEQPTPSPEASVSGSAAHQDPAHHDAALHDAAEHEHPAGEEPSLRDLSRRIDYWPRWALLALIRLYQATLSRALPPDTCRFYPTCSHYGYQAIYKYGFLKGGLMAAWRILRCNPFNKGGFDPVP